MDREPKTRQELKGKKGKEGKGVYNQKSIRLREEIMEWRILQPLGRWQGAG